MPIITFVGSRMETETKATLIRELTATATRVTGTPERFMTVIISEHNDTDIGLGGETLVDFKARLAGGRKSDDV